MSSNLRGFCNSLLIVVFLTFAVFAQTSGLPGFKKGERYSSARAKMIKAGWKPFASANADKCEKGDERCANRPEMESCAGTGLAPCVFRWKRKDKIILITTVGERNPTISGHRFEE